MIISHSIWMSVIMIVLLAAWMLFAAHFWKAYYTAHNMRFADPVFCRWIKSCLRIGFGLGFLSVALVPMFLYLVGWL